MWASGTISHMMREHFPVATNCRTDHPPETNKRPLTLTELAAAFLLLGFGLSVSVLAFAVEILSSCLISQFQTLKEIRNR